jgi:hypothetical protein
VDLSSAIRGLRLFMCPSPFFIQSRVSSMAWYRSRYLLWSTANKFLHQLFILIYQCRIWTARWWWWCRGLFLYLGWIYSNLGWALPRYCFVLLDRPPRLKNHSNICVKYPTEFFLNPYVLYTLTVFPRQSKTCQTHSHKVKRGIITVIVLFFMEVYII